MNTKRVLALVLALMMTLTLFGCGEKPAEDGTDDAPKTVTITDMIGRQVEIVPGSYQRVVCIGAGALRLYSYVGDVSLLCGVEDIDNTTLEERPKMFDGVARPYVMVYGDTFAALPSCGVGGPNAQAAEAEKILSCTPDIIVSEYEDTDKAEALQQQVGVPVITLRTGVDGVFSEDFSGSITLLGQVFGKETRASELLAFVSTETADIQARTAGIAEDSKPAVYICGLGNWGTTNHLMTIESYSTFTVANIKNTVSGLSAKGVQPIEAEKFTALGPDMDIMLIDAAAVKKISREWERGKWKARMKGAGIAVLVCLLLFGGWIAATEWFVFPVELENIQITNVRQLSDGRILYHFYIDDELGLRTLGFDYVEVNGEGHMYCVPKRALYTEKRETTSLADSEQEVDLEVCGAWARASGVDEELTHIWIGQGEDAILLWEKGMDLPAASAADEAQWGFREASAAYWKAHYSGTETVP